MSSFYDVKISLQEMETAVNSLKDRDKWKLPTLNDVWNCVSGIFFEHNFEENLIDYSWYQFI